MEESRQELFRAARQSFERIKDALIEAVLEAAPLTNASTTYRGLNIGLGNGALIIDPVHMTPADCLAASGHEPPFDVIAYTTIVVRKPRDRYDYEGRAHSLWFCDAHDEGVYRWYELAFMVSGLSPERFAFEPFDLIPADRNAAGALAPVMDIRQVAWQPLPFDQGDEEQFIERWMKWFAASADGTLSRPSRMPENSGGRYPSPRRRQRN